MARPGETPVRPGRILLDADGPPSYHPPGETRDPNAISWHHVARLRRDRRNRCCAECARLLPDRYSRILNRAPPNRTTLDQGPCVAALALVSRPIERAPSSPQKARLRLQPLHRPRFETILLTAVVGSCPPFWEFPTENTRQIIGTKIPTISDFRSALALPKFCG